MKREIKFRGRRIDNGEWVYGDLLQNGSICHISNFDNGVNREHYEVDPETVGQYIGMNDKDGVEIYEGDIVRNSNQTSLTLSDDDKLYVVEWQEGEYKQTENGADWLCNKPGFIFRKLHRGMKLIFSQHQIEVIGNIFENHELL